MKVTSLRLFLLSIALFISIFTARAQGEYLVVIAKPGDEIPSLMRRHGLEPTKHTELFLELNGPALGPGKSLIAGKRYRIPHSNTTLVKATLSSAKSGEAVVAKKTVVTSMAVVAKKVAVPNKAVVAKKAVVTEKAVSPKSTSKTLSASLFGPRYAKVVVRDQKLRGAVYYLSSGHGGPDPGAIGQYGTHPLPEDEYAYDVTLRLARVLMEHGATVYMITQDPNDGIRDEGVLQLDYDEVAYPKQAIPLNQVARLRQRTMAINALHARHKGAYQRMLAIHVDSRSIGQTIDVFFYHHERSAAGQRLAKRIHQTFTARYKRNQPTRNYFGNVSHRSSLYEVRNTHPPTVFIELGNIRNSKDQRRFLIPDNRQAVANWIGEGILRDYQSR